MEIGKRLRELRLARKLSQGDIEDRSGLFRCYVSRVEGGYTVPNVETLAKFARALDLELYQLFYNKHGKPSAPRPGRDSHLTPDERTLLGLFRRARKPDQKLLADWARFTARQR